MQESLYEKMDKKEVTFSDAETHWLLKNIGNESSDIRDTLVFTLLARGISEGGFSLPQYLYIKEKTTSDNLIFYHIEKNLPYTLTRSFAALLNGFIIQVDNDSHSPYYDLLSVPEKAYFFNTAVTYLQKEHVKTGFSSSYGWVHAFAHGGEYLSKAVMHNQFEKERMTDVLANVTS